MKKEIAAIYCRLSVEDAEKRAAETRFFLPGQNNGMPQTPAAMTVKSESP